MITLEQHGFECEYEMGVFIRLYLKQDEDAAVKTFFSEEDAVCRCECIIEYGGRRISAEDTRHFRDFYDDDVRRQARRGAVVGSFCRAAEKIRKIPLPWGIMSGIRPVKIVRSLIEKGYSGEQAAEIFGEVFGVSPQKRSLSLEVYKNEKPVLDSHDSKSAGLYIGIPFCPTRCSYCSFISSPIKTSGRYIPEFVSLLTEEIKVTSELMERTGIYPETIYIGGGTPTSLSEYDLDRILCALDPVIEKSGVKEITLEAGRPDTISRSKLETALKHGVNRISINPQTMHSETLEKIGRRHTPEDIERSFYTARECGFKAINMDLIAGLPGEDFEMFRESLERVAALGSENITVHTLCIKRAADTAKDFNDAARAGHTAEMLEYSYDRLKELSYSPYYMYRQKNMAGNLENVGYSKSGYEGIYNIKIMEEVQSIIALGGGGASKAVMGDRIERVFNFKDASEYIRRFDEIIERKKKIFDMIENYERRRNI